MCSKRHFCSYFFCKLLHFFLQTPYSKREEKSTRLEKLPTNANANGFTQYSPSGRAQFCWSRPMKREMICAILLIETDEKRDDLRNFVDRDRWKEWWFAQFYWSRPMKRVMFCPLWLCYKDFSSLFAFVCTVCNVYVDSVQYRVSVCSKAYMCRHMCARMYCSICLDIQCIRKYVHAQICTCTWTSWRIKVSSCTGISYARLVCLYVCKCICVYVCTYVRM